VVSLHVDFPKQNPGGLYSANLSIGSEGRQFTPAIFFETACGCTRCLGAAESGILKKIYDL